MTAVLPVRGLTAGDFSVVEDGKVRPIVSFAAIDVPEREPATAAWIREVASDVVSNAGERHRLIMIVMDDAVPHADSSFIRFGTKVAREIVDQLRPSDLAAVVFTFAGRNQTFTADRHKLFESIASYRPAPAGLACMLKPTQSCNVDAMDRLADVVAAAPAGRKMMFYVGVNPLPLVVEGGDRFDAPRISMDLFRKLQAANITVDTFDINGLLSGGPGEGLEDIRTLAENTGGRAFVNQNEPWTRVADVFSENDSYYLLGIESNAKTGDERFHKIRVQTTRSGATVRTRSGYFAPAPEKPKKPTNTPALDAALDTTLPSGGIPLDLSVAPFASPSGKDATLLVSIGVQEPASPGPSSPLREMELVARI